MGREKLLSIEPQELTFRFELRKPASCTIRFSNNSRDHVAFKVMTTNPHKYIVRPKVGVLLPRSSCNVKVTMRAPEEEPPNMQCKDKFMIKSVVASPDDTAESSRKLFKEEGRVLESCILRVVYKCPSHQRPSNFERSGAGSSRHEATLEERNSNDTEGQDQNVGSAGEYFIKGIIVVLVCVVIVYLLMKMLPVLWSLVFMMIMLVIKMTTKLVSDSVEDWIVKTLLYLSIHFFSVVFRRSESRPNNGS